MAALDEFLETGALPFIGRTPQLARIVTFWREALHGDGMRILLIEAEAGAGKSRLVHEAIERTESERGTVVHAKLYAELTSAIAPLLHEALMRTELGRQLARSSEEPTLQGVTEMIRRIGRLRPSMLVIEDIHLLAGAPVRELVQLLEAIEDEPIAIVVTARSQEYPARRVLERWSIEQLTLAPLDHDDLVILWSDLFAGSADDGAIAELATASMGNPLALRSALRGALRKQALRSDPAGTWHVDPSFASVAASSASSLVEGMLIAVSDDDRRAAGRLAALGEVFSREAASTLVDSETLERLVRAGLVHELAVAKPSLPMLSRSRSLPLAFTHSLVHHRLADEVTPPVLEIVSVVADALPLYSIHPFSILASAARDDVGGTDIELARRAIDVALNVALGLDRSSDWALAIVAHSAAERLYEHFDTQWSTEDRQERSVAIAARTLALLRREMTSDAFGAALDRFDMLTGDGLPEGLQWYRLAGAIAAARRRYLLEGYDAGRAVYDEIRALVETAPALREHPQYILVLQTFAQFAEENDDDAMRREIEREYARLVETATLSDDNLILAQTQVLPFLLTLFDDELELERRMEMHRELRQLEHHPSSMARMLVHALLPNEPKFLLKTGRIDELIEFIDARLDLVKAQGMMAVHAALRLYRLCAETLLGLDASEVISRLRELASERRAQSAPGLDVDARHVVESLLVRGDTKLAGSLVAEHAISLGSLPAGAATLLTLSERSSTDGGALTARAAGSSAAGSNDAGASSPASSAVGPAASRPKGARSQAAAVRATGQAAGTQAARPAAEPAAGQAAELAAGAQADVMDAITAPILSLASIVRLRAALSATTSATDAAAAHSGTAHSGTANSGTANSGPAHSGPAHSGTAHSGTAHSGTAHSGDVRSGAAQSGAARAGAAVDDGKRAPFRSALERALTWLDERRLDRIIRSMLDEYGSLLGSKELAAWKKRAAGIAADRAAKQKPTDADARLAISMLGRIEVRHPGESAAVQPRGARQKSFLGAMVGRELLARTFERDEFLEAAGIEQADDPKLARDAVNSALYRLRDIVGHEAVLNDEETPRLNLDLVRVDLIDAFAQMRQAERALRKGSLALAARSALDALELTRGEVPFPALYDTFFEALREDFENRLRSTVLSVARRLAAESDLSGALPLLERAFAYTPDDEEIAELYQGVLEKLGRRAEAERVRRRADADA